MATIDTVKAYNAGILRTTLSDAQATPIAQQIDAGNLTLAAYQQQLLLQARQSSIPGLVIDQVFTGQINATADVDYFAASYKAALASAQTLQPQASFAVQQLNAFQALGADLAGTASTNGNFNAQFGAFVGAGNTATAAQDLQFIQAAYNAVFPGVTPNAAVVAQYSAALVALRAQYGTDQKAKGALLGQIAGEAVVNNQTNTLFTSAESTLSSLATGGTFQAGPLGTNIVGGPGPGGTIILTTGADTKSGTAFEAPTEISQVGVNNQTLNASDVLTGTGKGATLNATLNSAININPSLTNIENVNLRTIATSNIDLGRATGVTKITHLADVAAADLTVRNIQAIAAVGVTDSLGGADSDSLFQFDSAALAATTDTVKVTLTNNGTATAASGDVNVTGLGAGVVETLDVTVVGTNRINSLGSDLAAGTGATTATNGATSYKFAGDGSIRVDTVLFNATTIDGSGLTKGGMRLGVDATKNVTVTGGAGADRINFAAGLTNADKYDGGAGRDTVEVSAATGLDTGNQITNVETLRVNGAATFVFDNDKISSIDSFVQNSTGALTFKNVVGANAADATKGLTILNTGAVDFQIKGADALGSINDAVYVNIGETGGSVAAGTNSLLQTTAGVATGALTFNNIEKVTLDVKVSADAQTSTGTGAITAAALQQIDITGGTATEAFTLSGGAAFGGAALISINAGTFAGNLTASGNAFSQQITGGSGDDNLATGGRQAFADTAAADALTGGAGLDVFAFATTDAALTGANLTTAAASVADGVREITAITDLNLGGSTAGSFVDRIDLSVVGGANAAGTLGFNANTLTIVNGGTAAALTGANLGEAVNNAVKGGVLGAGAAGEVRAGLFTFGGETYLIASEQTVVNDNFGAVASADLIVRVTGVTGTLSADDFTAF